MSQSPRPAVPAEMNVSGKSPVSPATEALLRAIDAKRQTDPLIGAKLGAKEVFQKLLHGMKGERGVHIESLLCALGALAGYACQASLRAQALAKGLTETSSFITVKSPDGRQYFFGDPLNQALAEAPHSIWSMAAGAAQQLGCQTLPDIKPMFEHVVQSVGTAAFGVPRLPDGRVVGDTPSSYLKAMWPVLLPTVTMYCKEPAEWPLLFGAAIQEAMEAGKALLPPAQALVIVMESAIPMSKVDLDAMSSGLAASPGAQGTMNAPSVGQDIRPDRRRWIRALRSTNEGRIFVVACALYLLVGLLAKASPAMASAFGVIGFFALYMPPVLLVFLHRLGVLRQGYVASRFNTGCMLVVALVPFLSVAKQTVLR